VSAPVTPEIPEAEIRPTAYAVSCLPPDSINARHFTLKVEYRRDGKWVVTDRFEFLSRTGTWSMGYSWRDGSQEPTTDADYDEVSAGQDAWRVEHWHDLDTALALAKQRAPHMTVNGHTVADALAREAA
jgi:hypothetical protein